MCFVWWCLRFCDCVWWTDRMSMHVELWWVDKCVGRTLIQKKNLIAIDSQCRWVEGWKSVIFVLLWWMHPCGQQTHVPFAQILLIPGRILVMLVFHLLLRTLPNSRCDARAPSISRWAQPIVIGMTYLENNRKTTIN